MTDDVKAVSDRQKLLESLWQDAEREADTVKSQATADADRMLKDAVRSAEEGLNKALDKVRHELEPSVSRILNRSREEVRRKLLVGRYTFLRECLQEARTLITENGVDGAREALQTLLPESLADLPPGVQVVVKVHTDDVARARKLLAEKGITAEVQADENILGGAAVIVDGGKEVRDNTLSTRLKTLGESPPLEILCLLVPPKDENRSEGSAEREVPPGRDDL